MNDLKKCNKQNALVQYKINTFTKYKIKKAYESYIYKYTTT